MLEELLSNLLLIGLAIGIYFILTKIGQRKERK